ncbi:hypothetical protein [Kordiimonas aestuarii]|uniref:hypothetical protein n=1 Tax=Kordiimonas aestuarii TaxID=1005925 RepID=UPI0021D1CC43|nr:hypothetical protein [Kordiimonas aestuarii]
MKKLIVHMGAHRCASSATQALLRRNCAEIERKVCLVLRDDLRAEAHGIAMNRFHAYRWWSPVRRAEVSRTIRAVEQVEQNTILVSEENLMGVMPGHRGQGFFPGFRHLTRALARLDPVAEVHPRLIVRRQDKLIESIYGFRVAFGLRDDFSSFLKQFIGMDLSWLRFADDLTSAGFAETARIDVLEGWPRGSATSHVLAFLGLHDLTLAGGGLRSGNSRFGAEALELLLAMNRCALGLDMSWRRAILFPALRKAKHADTTLVQELLELGDDETSVLKAALAMPSRFQMTDEERKQMLSPLKGPNRQFLKHRLVGSDEGCWYDDAG